MVDEDSEGVDLPQSEELYNQLSYAVETANKSPGEAPRWADYTREVFFRIVAIVGAVHYLRLTMACLADYADGRTDVPKGFSQGEFIDYHVEGFSIRLVGLLDRALHSTNAVLGLGMRRNLDLLIDMTPSIGAGVSKPLRRLAKFLDAQGTEVVSQDVV